MESKGMKYEGIKRRSETGDRLRPMKTNSKTAECPLKH